MIKTKVLAVAALSLCVAGLYGCGDDDEEKDPSNTITLNMMNEDNGKTILGQSDVYITDAGNFKSSDCFIRQVGETKGLGAKPGLDLSGVQQEVAVVPGNMYQVFDGDSFRTFPSGERAVAIYASYYKVYVPSLIQSGGVNTGAVVKYVEEYPDSKGLPALGSDLGKLNRVDSNVTVSLPSDNVEYYLDEHYGSGEHNAFSVNQEGNRLTVTLLKSPNDNVGPWGDYDIYLRSGNVYTRVSFTVGYRQ